MNPCANCDQPIGFKTLLFSIFPVWVTCPHCQAKLVGSRLVRLVVLVQSLVIAAIFVFLGLVQSAGDFLSGVVGDPGTSIVVETALVALGVVILIVWPAGLFLVKRFGKFVAVSDDPAADGGIRNYLLATGVVSFILATWAVIYAGYSPFTVVFLVTWALIPFLLLYRFYDFRLGPRLGRAAFFILLLWAGIANLSALVFAVYAGVNFPKARAFEERLIFPVAGESEEKGWYQFRDLVNNDEPKRDDVLEFLAANVVSVPQKEVSFRAELPRVIFISRMAEDEIADIKELIVQGKEAEAEAKYTRLWKAADNLLTGSGGLIIHLVAMGMITRLVDFQIGDEAGPPIAPNPELLEISAHVSGELDRSFEKAMALEYQTVKFSLLEMAQPDCGSRPLNLCFSELKWPFFDMNQYLSRDHAYYSSMVAVSRDPTSRAADQIIRDRTAEIEELRLSIFNPVGSVLRAIVTPLIINFADNTTRVKGSVLIFNYVMEYRRSGNLGDPPIDPFTGQPFIVTDKGATIEITSARRQGDEPAVKYEVKKLVR